MDPNTNIPTDSSEPLPLGPPLHPEDTTTEPEPEVGPVVFQPQTQVEPSLPQPAYMPNVPPSPLPGPGNVFSSAQNPPIPPASPLPGAQPLNSVFNPQPAFNPQAVTPTPGAPAAVSGSFVPGQAMRSEERRVGKE